MIDSKSFITAPAQQLPVCGTYDVIVAGGGPAGFAAALRAAREGCQVLLLEKNECLGGIWTAGLMPWILDHQNKVGFLTEIKEKLSERGGFFPRPGTFTAPPEEIRFLSAEFAHLPVRNGWLRHIRRGLRRIRSHQKHLQWEHCC